MLIPDRQRRKLHIALEQYAPLHTRSKVPYGVPLSVQVTYPKGKLMLNCGRSKTKDVFISPAQQEQPRNSEASDTPSLWSHSTSLISRQGLWSSNASTRSSNDSTASLPAQNEASASTPTLPQFPGSAMLSTSAGNYSPSSKSPPMTPLYKAPSLQSMSALSLSHSSPQQRSSLPPPATASPTLDGYKANRISEPPVKNMMSTNEDDRHHNVSL
jgi:hypothetical protein